ncbi:MAG TPA: hypothetical protein VGS80_21585 [Ktedonobacterales bacterium]|jgi:hypothetical protein|nr:hypothetical protein [Ktedonobacterales bacterium]
MVGIVVLGLLTLVSISLYIAMMRRVRHMPLSQRQQDRHARLYRNCYLLVNLLWTFVVFLIQVNQRVHWWPS